MPFDWTAFLELARSLRQQAESSVNPESCLRTALSRAYFGAYCHARNYAGDFLDFQVRENSDDHGRLRAHLKGKRRSGDANRLDTLRRWRNQVDYVNDLGVVDLKQRVTEAISYAEKIFASLTPPPMS